MFLFFYFWPGAVEKARKQNEEKKKTENNNNKKKREALQISLSGVWKPSNFIRNEHKKKNEKLG